MNTLMPYRWMGLPRKQARRKRPPAGAQFGWLGSITRLLFGDLRLERKGTALHVTFDTQVSEIATPAAVDPASAEAQELRAALKTLLDAHPMTRQVMRHLACFDHALSVRGLKALMELPVEALLIAVEQLEVLVSNWSNPQLAALRSKMAVAVVDRSEDPFYGRAGDKLSNFNTDSRLFVGDASHSMFMELERQYEHVLPAPAIRAVLDRVRRVATADDLPAHIAPDRIPTLHGGSSR